MVYQRAGNTFKHIFILLFWCTSILSVKEGYFFDSALREKERFSLSNQMAKIG